MSDALLEEGEWLVHDDERVLCTSTSSSKTTASSFLVDSFLHISCNSRLDMNPSCAFGCERESSEATNMSIGHAFIATP